MKYIPVGRALATHGIKGEVKFRYYNEAKEEFLRYASLFLKIGDHYTELEVTGRRFQKGLFYVTFKGLESPDEVSTLVNRELFVREADLPHLESDEYYDYQLIGLDIVDRKNEKIGIVKALLHTKTRDLLVVTVGEGEVYVPLMEHFIVRIDLEGSSIMVDESVLVS
jgi:16S rRNA processing protein RimM